MDSSFWQRMAQFGLHQINDPKLSKVDFTRIRRYIFKDVAIADGITIVYKNVKKTNPGFTYVYHKNGVVTTVEMKNPGEELMHLNPQDSSVVSKVANFVETNGLSYVSERILPRSLFGIESNFVEENPSKVWLYTSDADIDFSKEIKLYANDKAGKAGRSTWYVANKDVITVNKEYIAEWQVVVSSANAGGQKRSNQIEIIDNHSAFGRSRVAIGSFKTRRGCELFNYSQTNLILSCTL